MQVHFANHDMFYVEQLLPKDLCRTILDIYARDPAKNPGHVVGERGDEELQDHVKVSTDLVITLDGAWQAAFTQVHDAVSRALQQIVDHVPALQIWPLWSSGYKIQYYRKNEGHFKWHCDAVGPGSWQRQLAMVLYLNTVQEGGETSFDRQNLQLKPIEGDAVFFPPFWTHAHCGQMSISEDKAIISSFFSFDIPGVAKEGVYQLDGNCGARAKG